MLMSARLERDVVFDHCKVAIPCNIYVVKKYLGETRAILES